MQLPRASHPPHTPPNFDRSSTTLACSLILSRLDDCNSLLHGDPTRSISKLQRVQNNAGRIILRASRRSHAQPLLCQLHWLPVHNRTDYKLAVMTYKIHCSSTLAYLSCHIKLRQSARFLHSSDVPLLDKPTIRTEFAKCSFQYLETDQNSVSVSVSAPKLGDIFSIGYSRNCEAQFRPTFGYNRNYDKFSA